MGATFLWDSLRDDGIIQRTDAAFRPIVQDIRRMGAAVIMSDTSYEETRAWRMQG